jgi:hypothetical protein
MNSDFEKRLQEQRMREIPRHWRAQMLAAAQTPPAASWREWLWPCPRAWAGLAAAWVMILGMNLAAEKGPSQLASKKVAFSRQELQELRRQQQILTELISPQETAETGSLKRSAAPRSERRKTVFMGYI